MPFIPQCAQVGYPDADAFPNTDFGPPYDVGPIAFPNDFPQAAVTDVHIQQQTYRNTYDTYQ